jgi:predicted esterase
MAPAEPLVGKPRIFVSHGTQDPILSVAASRDRIVPALREDGYDVTYEEFVGGHQVPRVVSEQALDWFLA